ISAHERSKWEPQLEEWEQQARRVFLASYDEIACASGLYASFEEMAPLLRLFELDTALADLRHELLNRVQCAEVPLRRLAALARRDRPPMKPQIRRQHRMPFGAQLTAAGEVRFRLWALAARQVD